VVHLDRVTDQCRGAHSAPSRKQGRTWYSSATTSACQHSIMMSVEMWRAWLKPRLARIIAAGREVNPDLLIFYHSCGFVMPFIPELIEVGVTS